VAELMVAALLGDPAFVEHHDLVAPSDWQRTVTTR
jgi:hypothetical protein